MATWLHNVMYRIPCLLLSASTIEIGKLPPPSHNCLHLTFALTTLYTILLELHVVNYKENLRSLQMHLSL